MKLPFNAPDVPPGLTALRWAAGRLCGTLGPSFHAAGPSEAGKSLVANLQDLLYHSQD